MKAVIVECHDNHAIALRDDGQFVRVKGAHHEIGNVVKLSAPKRSVWGKVAAAAASVCLLVTFGGSYTYFAQETYSVVSLDINPSIEYALNRFDKVVSVKGVNIDGEAVVEAISDHVVKRDITTALTATVDSLCQKEYIRSDSDNYVIVSVYSKSEKKQQTLNSKVEQFSEESVDVCSVTTVSVTQEEKEAAESLGITAGKLILANEAAAALGENEITDTVSLASLSVEELTAITQGTAAETALADQEEALPEQTEADEEKERKPQREKQNTTEDPDSSSSTDKGTGEAASDVKTPAADDEAQTTEEASEQTTDEEPIVAAENDDADVADVTAPEDDSEAETSSESDADMRADEEEEETGEAVSERKEDEGSDGEEDEESSVKPQSTDTDPTDAELIIEDTEETTDRYFEIWSVEPEIA